MDKIFAVGDIHGCFDKLDRLIKKIGINFDNDTIVFMGDYIDRGPDSFKVVEFLINIKKKCPNSVFLKGNHEVMLENYISGKDMIGFIQNGGRATIESYLKGTKKSDRFYIPPEHKSFFNSLVLYYETEQYIFVHAGLKKKFLLKNRRLKIFYG